MENHIFLIFICMLHPKISSYVKIEKATHVKDKPFQFIEEQKDLLAFFTYNNFKYYLAGSTFPTGPKYADLRLA